MVDNIFVLNQVYELQIILNKLCDLFIQIPKPFPVGEIIAKLPPNLNRFRKKLSTYVKNHFRKIQNTSM